MEPLRAIGEASADAASQHAAGRVVRGANQAKEAHAITQPEFVLLRRRCSAVSRVAN